MLRLLHLLTAAVSAVAFAQGASLHARAAGGTPVAATDKAQGAETPVAKDSGPLVDEKKAPAAAPATAPASAAAPAPAQAAGVTPAAGAGQSAVVTPAAGVTPSAGGGPSATNQTSTPTDHPAGDKPAADKPTENAAVAAPIDVIVPPVKRVMPKPVLLHATPKPAPKALLKTLTEKDAKAATASAAGAKPSGTKSHGEKAASVKPKPRKLSENEKAGKKVSRD